MPNNNPSGANQPLNQHPLPINEIYTVARDAAILSGLSVSGGDQLLVPPPVEGGIRFVPDNAIQVLLEGSGGTDTADVAIVYKNASGQEVVIASDTLAPPAALSLPNAAFYLKPDDQGLFVRMTADAASGIVKAIAAWRDVRNVERFDVLLPNTTFQNLHGDVPLGNCYFFPTSDVPGEEGASIRVLNFDDVSHDVVFNITDGVNNVVSPTPFTAPAGESVLIPAPEALTPPGWHLQARLADGETVSTVTPVIVTPAALTNQGPARQDQGGAY